MMEMTKHTQNDPQSQEKENVTQENSRHMEKIGMVQRTRCQNHSSWIYGTDSEVHYTLYTGQSLP